MLVGVALLVLPGPGVLVILFAMSILATELPWARAYQDKLRALLRLRRMRKSIPPPPPAPPPPENE